jgi:hypothetical protein
MAYKRMGRDTGMAMPMGITCVACLVCLVAMGCSAADIGRPSAGIGRVISGEIGGSNYRHNAEQQIANCELKEMDTHTMGMSLAGKQHRTV